MQLVQSILITYDINIIKYGSHLAVTERYFEFCAGIVQPGILLDPVILLGVLQVILEYLLEQSEVVIQTDTVPGKSQGSDGIQEAGCQQKEEEGYKKLVASLEGINVSQGLRYCVYRMPVYIAALRIFVNLEWMDKLNYYLNKNNLKKYGESLHYVKRCARSIGAQEFADWSLAMSNAVKRGDLAYLQENEQEFMKSYQHIHDVVKKALQSYDEERL